MRHLDKGRSLSRSPSHRKAVLANLAQELFQHKRIRTTLIKAKELRPFAEKLVTTAKRGHLSARRTVLRYLSRRAVVKSLFEEIAPTFADRNGGYTRIIKLGNRIGDNAPMAMVELVGFEGMLTTKLEESDKAAKKAEAEKRSPLKSRKKTKAKEGAKALTKTAGGKKKSSDRGGTGSRLTKKAGDR